MNTNKTGSAEAATETIALESITVLTPGSAPIALELARIGGIGETVDGSVWRERSQRFISPGIVAVTLVSALLCGCRALYNMKSFWEEPGCAAWFEKNDFVPEQLNDDVHTQPLDKFSEYDMRGIVETVAFRLRAAHGIKVFTVHFDTTSVSVEGDYATTKEKRGEERHGRPRMRRCGRRKDFFRDRTRALQGASSGPVFFRQAIDLRFSNQLNSIFSRPISLERGAVTVPSDFLPLFLRIQPSHPPGTSSSICISVRSKLRTRLRVAPAPFAPRIPTSIPQPL